VNRPAKPDVCYERCVQRGAEPPGKRRDGNVAGSGEPVDTEIFDRSAPTSPTALVAVAFGGVIGATGRWGVAEAVDAIGDAHPPGAWAWATLIVNLVGSILIGIAARRLDRNSVAWAFAVTGVLGGFTTFSALAVETNDLADAGRMPLAIGYGALTLAAGVAAAALGQRGVGPSRPTPAVPEAAT